MHSHALIFIQDLAVMMLIAGLATILCHRLKQPIVLGYIVAGIIIGPHTPPFSFISDEMTIKTLGELGVILLMFSLGLEFNLHKLSKVGVTAFVAATLEIAIMIGVGYEIGRWFDWSRIDSLFLGALLSISSTTIIVKALGELGMKREAFAQLIFGILIVEDIFAILILALLSSVATSGLLEIKDVVVTSAKLVSFLVISMLLGILLVPRLITYVARFKSDEMLLITVLGLCFGFSLLVVKLDYSVALGAFVIGAIIAESRQLNKIENLVNPIRDMFSAIFFISVGLLLDLHVMLAYWFPIAVIVIAVIIGKVASCSLGVLATGRDGKTAMRVGMGLAQIGEFSFIIASLGLALNVTGTFLYPIAVGVSIVTTLLTPYLIRYSDTFTKQFARIMPNSLANIFEVYSSWMQNIEPGDDQGMLVKVVKRGITHVVVNLLIVVAIFLSGAYLAKTDVGVWLMQVTSVYAQKTIVWALALMVSLPFLIAAYRKTKALSMILAELSVKERVGKQLTFKVRKVISELIPLLSIIGIMVFVSLLSASILPPIEWLSTVVLVAILLLAFLAPWLIKLHAKLQINLMNALSKDREDSE